MKANLTYLALMLYFAAIPAIVIGLLVAVFDPDSGLITMGVVFGWQFIELIFKRKSNWRR